MIILYENNKGITHNRFWLPGSQFLYHYLSKAYNNIPFSILSIQEPQFDTSFSIGCFYYFVTKIFMSLFGLKYVYHVLFMTDVFWNCLTLYLHYIIIKIVYFLTINQCFPWETAKIVKILGTCKFLTVLLLIVCNTSILSINLKCHWRF